jgi:putative photosynthetic complex assembly protein
MSSSTPRVTIAPDSFPRWVLLCAGGIILFSLLAVGLIRITGNGPDQRAAAAVQERLLRFEDRPDGGVSVLDGKTGAVVAELHGEQGFVRGVLRALARERRSRDLGSQQPFQLISRVDGRLTLLDPATSERVDLESFGPANAAIFAAFLGPIPKQLP